MQRLIKGLFVAILTCQSISLADDFHGQCRDETSLVQVKQIVSQGYPRPPRKIEFRGTGAQRSRRKQNQRRAAGVREDSDLYDKEDDFRNALPAEGHRHVGGSSQLGDPFFENTDGFHQSELDSRPSYLDRLGNSLFGSDGHDPGWQPGVDGSATGAAASTKMHKSRNKRPQNHRPPSFSKAILSAGLGHPSSDVVDTKSYLDGNTDTNIDMLSGPPDKSKKHQIVAASDTSTGLDAVVAPEDREFVDYQIGKARDFIQQKRKDVKAYEDQVQKEKHAYQKRLNAQRQFFENRTHSAQAYLDNEKAQVQAYLTKQQDAVESYQKAQLEGASKFQEAKQEIAMMLSNT